MIETKKDLRFYLQKDAEALGINHKSMMYRMLRNIGMGEKIWKFQYALRHHEYWLNRWRRHRRHLLLPLAYWKWRHDRLGLQLGFSVPCNVFGYGLRINHYGLLVVNAGARIGNFCDIHQGVNIGQNILPGSVPTLGDNVWIGPGVKIFGKIKIASRIAIGAGAVVNKSFTEENITIAGVPACKVKDGGDPYHRK